MTTTRQAQQPCPGGSRVGEHVAGRAANWLGPALADRTITLWAGLNQRSPGLFRGYVLLTTNAC